MCMYWKSTLEFRKGGEYDREWLLHKWAKLKDNYLRLFPPWNSQWGAKETNFGCWPHAYILEEYAQISERRRLGSKMIAAQLNEVESQLITSIFIPKFVMGGWAPETIPCITRWDPAQLKITAKLSNWFQCFDIKNRNEGSVSLAPTTISGGGVAQLNHPNVTFKFRIDEGLETFPSLSS